MIKRNIGVLFSLKYSLAPIFVVLTSCHAAPRDPVIDKMKANVFIASSAVDTDLSVRLCDVYPDGKSYLIAEGILRLRYRHSLEKTEPFAPGKIEKVTV